MAALSASGVVLLPEEAEAANHVPRFAVLEATLTQEGQYKNPYTEVIATATFTRHESAGNRGNATLTIPLFWDGGTTWKLRFSPPETGEWVWAVQSNDDGLNGRAGLFRCVASKQRGSITPMEDHRRHFQYQDGTPLYWFGETGWAIYTDNPEKKADRKSVEHFLNKRAHQGFTIVHSHLICENDLGNQGGRPFADLESESINPAYWQEVDHRLRYATDQGMIAGLALAWTDKGSSKQSWQKFPSDAARRRYARYIVARFSAFPVYFLVAGEWDAWQDHKAGRALYNALGAQIKADDPHKRMVGIHEYPQYPNSLMPFRDSNWNDFADYQQNYNHLHASILACRELNKPIVNSEYGYYRRTAADTKQVNKANSENVDVIRAATWDIVMAGGYVITGFGSTYYGGGRNPGFFDVDAPQNKEWEAQVQHVRMFWTALPWWKLEPHDESISALVPRGADEGVQGDRAGRPPRVAYWAMSEPGVRTIGYVRGIAQPCTLTLEAASGKSCRVRRFDPRTGAYTDLTAPIDMVFSFTPPDEQDYVYLVEVV